MFLKINIYKYIKQVILKYVNNHFYMYTLYLAV